MTKTQILVQGNIIDLTHVFTDPIYLFIQKRTLLVRIIIILLGVHINLSLSVVIYNTITTNNFRKLVFMVFLSKAICNLVYQSPPPEGRNGKVAQNRNLHWSKKAQQETFFSGHTALCALAISVTPVGQMKTLLTLGSILTITTIIILRVHYIIDVIGSLLVVYFFYTRFM